MKSLFTKYVWLQLILSILLIFGGTIIIVFALNGKPEVLADALNITIAVILFLFGAFSILASFLFGAKNTINLGFLYGSVSIALGILLCAKNIVLLDHLVYLLSVFLIVFGAVELIKAIINTIFRFQSLVLIILTYIFATVFIVGGILSIIYRENVTIAFCITAGSLIVLMGLFLLVIGIKLLIDERKRERAAEQSAPVEQKPEPEEEANVQEVDAIEQKEIEAIEQK